MKKYYLLLLFTLYLCLTCNAALFSSGTDTLNAEKYYQLMMSKIDADSTLTVGYARQAIAFAQKGGSQKIESDVYNNLGVFYGYKG